MAASKIETFAFCEDFLPKSEVFVEKELNDKRT